MKHILILCILLFNSCEKVISWDEFALKKTQYNGSQLKTEGYYYQLTDDGKYFDIYCFYRNGVLLHLDGSNYQNKAEVEEYIHQEFTSDPRIKDMKQYWGLFVVDQQNFKLEHYYPSDKFNKSAYIQEGTIINDSTINITVQYRSNGSERNERDVIFHFNSYSPKPDSTNNFF